MNCSGGTCVRRVERHLVASGPIEIVLHGTRLVPDEKNVGHKVRRYGAAEPVSDAENVTL